MSQKSKISVKLENSNDKERYEIVAKELEHFEKLIKGHRKILAAIGNL